MSGLLQSLEILNLPHEGTNWNIGDKIDFEGGKNVMLVGSNGSGKSTILQILHESMNRSKDVLAGINMQKIAPHPYDKFAGCFDGYSWKINPYGHESEEGYTAQDYNDDLLSAFCWGLSDIYGEGILNFWDERYTSTSMHVHELIKSYVNRMNQESGCEGYKGAGESFDAAQDVYQEGAKLFAQENGISEEVVYGNLVLILEGIHGKLLNGSSQWGHVRVLGDNNFLNQNRIVLDNSEPNGESLGERSKRIIDELKHVKDQTIGILDEPTNGIDMISHEDHVNSIMDISGKVQMIASTHDSQLFEAVSESDDWIVHNLGEKRVV